MKRLFLFIFLFPLLLSAQETKGILIKTLPLQDIFYQNPNITLEWKFNSKYSLSMSTALRNGAWYDDGGEGPPFPKFQTSSGYTFGFSGRLYIPNKKAETKPSKWFTAVLLRYNYTLINNASIQSGISEEPRKVNLLKKGPELGTTFGRQFIFNYLMIELYTGIGAQLQYYDEEYISGDESTVKNNITSFAPRFYLGFAIGLNLAND